MPPRRVWAIWAGVTLLTVPVSFMLWLVGGTAMCGEEVYDTPPGSAGDALCDALVEPIAPWAALAAVPTMLAAAGGFAALRLGTHRLFVFSLIAPFVLAMVSIQAFLVVF